MDSAHHHLQTKVKEDDGKISNDEENNHTTSIYKQSSTNFHFPKLQHLKWWLRVATYILCLLVGQTTGVLLGRLYYDNGGNSKWLTTFVQTAGFPILIPLFYLPHKPSVSSSHNNSPSPLRLTLLYISLGVLLAFGNLMYANGLLYLPVSTYSLLSATQLAFNAVSSYFINGQKFTILILNSIVILSISAVILGVNAKEGDDTSNIPKGKSALGFLCTLGASTIYALYLSLIQLSFKKVIKRETFETILDMQMYPSFVATIVCVVGLFASGEWRNLTEEMKHYDKGTVSYMMILVWTAIVWQVSLIGFLGLVFEVSSLFSNVIGVLGLPLVPVFAVIFFHDKMNGMKVIALVLALWGFLSYIYQHYLDDVKVSKDVKGDGKEVVDSTIQVC